MTITFHVTGTPKPQPRPRAFARKVGASFVARVYDAGTAEGWKSQIAIAARDYLPAVPLAGPLRLSVAFSLERPKSHYGSGRNADRLKDAAPRHHISKPDLDNLIKAVKDCLTTLGMWKDDSQIVHETCDKQWHTAGGATITITPIESEAT